MTIPKKDRGPKYALLDFDFLAAMADVFDVGLKDGRKKNDWRKIENTDANFDAYVSALMRHLRAAIKRREAQCADEDHFAAVAANANILWHMAMQPRKENL